MSGVCFVRFYPSDWRSGCIGLSFEEEGLYIRICAHFWETGRRLPLDDRAASSRLCTDIRHYRRVKKQLIEKGKLSVAEDGIYNARAEHEFSLANGSRQKGTEAQAGVDSARGHDDHQQANGGDQAQKRGASWPELLGKSPTSLRQVSNKSPTSLEQVCQKTVKNQHPSIEPVANSQSYIEKKNSQSSNSSVCEADRPPDDFLECKTAFNGSTESMLAEVAKAMGSYSDRRQAETWLANLLRFNGQPAVVQSYQMLLTAKAEGQSIVRVLPWWSKTASTLKANAPKPKKFKASRW